MAKIDSMYNMVNSILDEKSLVIFLGGGASMEGTQGEKPYPSFEKLIDTILQDWGFNPDEKKERLTNFLTILKKWEDEKILSARLSRYLDGEPGLSHYYLAALSIALFGGCNLLLYLTTNFDDLMRKAFTDLERNQVRRFNTVAIPLHPNISGSEFHEIASNVEVHSSEGRPVILKLFGDLYSQTPIFRQDNMEFHPEVENKLMEWMKKPMIIIGYSFSDKIIEQLFIASRSTSPVFLVNPSRSIPNSIRNLARVHHIQKCFTEFIEDMINILEKRGIPVQSKIETILKNLDTRVRYPDFNSLKFHITKCSEASILRVEEKLPKIEINGEIKGFIPVDRKDAGPDFQRFVKSERPLLVVIGDAGSGKSTLLYKEAKNQANKEFITLFYDVHHLQEPGSLKKRLSQDFMCNTEQLDNVFDHIDKILSKENRTLLIMVDGLNESATIDPSVLKVEIEDFGNNLPKSIKVVYSCRIIYWNYYVKVYSPISRQLYLDSKEFLLHYYSSVETRNAFDLYQFLYKFEGSFDTLKEEFKDKIRDPLMLRMLAEGYQGSKLPLFAPGVKIFKIYEGELRKKFKGTVLIEFIEVLISSKLSEIESKTNVSDQFEKETFITNPVLSNLTLQQIGINKKKPVTLLEDDGILTSLDDEKSIYRFTYDRFFQYFLGKEMGRKFAIHSREDFIRILGEKIPAFQKVHFSFIKALKSEIIRQNIIDPDGFWSFYDIETLRKLLTNSTELIANFVKEVIRELTYESERSAAEILREIEEWETLKISIEMSVANRIEEEIRVLIDTKSNMDYLEARVKMLKLKKIQPDKFGKLQTEFNFRFDLDSAPDDDIHIKYRKKVAEKPFIYGVEFTNETKNGCVNLAIPHQQFMVIPETVFSFMSQKYVAQLEPLEIRERLEKRTQTLEQLFQLNLYHFAREELRDILELIEKNAGDVLTPLKEKIIAILKEHYAQLLKNTSTADVDETEKTNYEFKNKIRFILEWGEFFSTKPIELVLTDFAAVPHETTQMGVQLTPIKEKESFDSQKKGYKLEKGLFELFQNLFMLNDSHEIKVIEKEIEENERESRETMLKQKRWQQAGIQYGYDLEFTWDEILISPSENSPQKSEVKCCIECKHYSNNIDHNEIFGKLAQIKAFKPDIDHWILISPHANLTPTAISVLEKTRKDYPFDIQIWTPEFRVEELFGINPEVFEELYELLPQYREDKIQNPQLWTDEYRLEIKKKWLEKLPPRYRLPSGKVLPESWVENLKNPGKSLISYEGEDEQQMLDILNLGIKDDARLCLNEDGLIGTLLNEYLEWLDDKNCSVLALLGEFGSGKSLHGYSLGIETAKNFLKSPQKYRIPIRLTLKHCLGQNIQDVLDQQLESMKTNYNEFVALSPNPRILFILDGFDEMSRYITQAVTNERLGMLRKFCDKNKEAKILLTCRTQFFKSAQEEEETIEALKSDEKFKIKKLYLGKFADKEIRTCLQNRYGTSPNDITPQVMHEKMKSKYDLIGMSSNPLILSMIIDILDDISTDCENLSGIYETYVDKWLEREISKLDIVYKRTDIDSLKEKVKQVMYELAFQIYKRNDFKLSYDDLKTILSIEKREALEFLNEITKYTGETDKNIAESIKTRSFLVRENDFFRFVHRSIMEYFIAVKIYRELMEENGADSVGAIQLSFEIINFVVDLATHKNPLEFLKKLRTIDFREIQRKSENNKCLSANILSVFYSVKKTMTEKGLNLSGIEENWSGIIAHGSLLQNADLSGTIFRNADLSESHLENADLRDSDFTCATLTNIVLGETEDIVYSKWGPISEEIPYSIHFDGNLFKWEVSKQTPLPPSKIKTNIILPCDISFPNGLPEVFIGGALVDDNQDDDAFMQKPTLLSIDNTGQFIVFYKKNRIIVFDVKELNNLYTNFKKSVTALYLGYGGKFMAYIIDKKEVYYGEMVPPFSDNLLDVKDNSSPVTGIAVDQMGSIVYLGFENGEIQCYTKNSESNSFNFDWGNTIHEKAVKNISYNDATHRLLSCGADKKIIITDGKNGQKKHRLQMLLKCSGMKIKDVIGLTPEKEQELLSRGAIS